MPFVSVKLLQGRTTEQKQELARRITEDVVEVLKTSAESVWVTFEELPPADWTVAGKPLGPPR